MKCIFGFSFGLSLPLSPPPPPSDPTIGLPNFILNILWIHQTNDTGFKLTFIN